MIVLCDFFAWFVVGVGFGDLNGKCVFENAEKCEIFVRE